jgi:predicted Fe-Mo cluster-binding NifX family protein
MTTEQNIMKILSVNMNRSDKVFIPVKPEGKNEIYTICNDMNSASHYCIIDFKQSTIVYMGLEDIKEVFSRSDGQGFNALQVSSLICNGISPMSLRILADNGISVFKPVGSNVEQNLNLFINNKLKDSFSVEILKSASCNSTCDNCNTVCN